MAAKAIILFDRSRAATDWTCERKRYLNYELDGRGIVPAREALELRMGTIMHHALAEVAQGRDPLVLAMDAQKAVMDYHAEADADYRIEQGYLFAGLILGFAKHVWPRLYTRYPKILAVEQEMTYTYQGITFMAKPDLVALTPEGEVVYIEYKTTSTKKEEWVNSWGTAIQLHATSRAIEENLGVKVNHIVVQGLYKGYESYGKQGSPFCYSYHKEAIPPFQKEVFAYEYKSGYRRYPVWQMEGGLEAWIAKMPEQVLADQFPCTPPIFVKDDMVEAFFAQRVVREREIDLATTLLDMPELDEDSRKDILNTSFPQNFSECVPSFGKACPYRRICFGEVQRLEGQPPEGFVYREPHHAPEEAILPALRTKK